MSSDESPIYSPFFGVMGATSAMVFGAMGAAYGTAKESSYYWTFIVYTGSSIFMVRSSRMVNVSEPLLGLRKSN